MWPFKKQPEPPAVPPPAVVTVICIPGTWKNWEEFIIAVVGETQGEYIAAGNILMHVKGQRHYTIEFCERDERMQEAFRAAGLVTRVSDDFLQEIDRHQHVIYISGPGGNLTDAGHIAFAAEVILRTGGIGIKIETTGKAFEKQQWQDLIHDFEPSHLYELFVVDSITDQDGTVYSCGMHNLGYKDTIVSGEEFQQAVNLIRIFGYYQLVDKPTLLAGQTFQADIESPRYRIKNEERRPGKGVGLFENPFGVWRLERG